MWVIRYFLVTVVILLIVGFAVQNSYQRVDEVNLLNHSYVDIPLIVVLFEAFVLGVFFWFILSIAHFFKMHGILGKLKRENKELVEEIKTIRNMPLQDGDEYGQDTGLDR